LRTTIVTVAFAILSLVAVTEFADAGSALVHAAIAPVQQLLRP